MFSGVIALLGLTGVGGIAGLVLHLFGWSGTIAKLRGFGQSAKAGAKKVPKQVWYGAAVIAALVGGYFYHQHVAHKAVDTAYKKGHADAVAEFEKNGAKTNTQTAAISNNARGQNEAENRHIDSRAAAVVVRGPGRAVCPGAAPAAGGHVAPTGPVDAGLARVPYPEWQQLLAVPFDDTVAFAREHDKNLDEVKRWRQWHVDVLKVWPKPQH